MGLADWWYDFRTTRLSKPAEERSLYQATHKRSVHSVLQVGVGDGARATKLVQWLDRQGSSELRYAAIDMFEAEGGIALKDFHALLKGVGAKPLLVPGTLAMGLPRVVSTIGTVDLLLLNTDVDAFDDPIAQSFLSRIVHEETIVIATDEDQFLYDLEGTELLASSESRVAA